MKIYRITPYKIVPKAISLIDEYQSLNSRLRKYRLWQKRLESRPLPLRHDEQAWKEFENYISEKIKEIEGLKKKMLSFIDSVGGNLNYVNYLQASPLAKPAILSILAEPPDITWGRTPLVHPWTWITFTFLPPKDPKDDVIKAGKIAFHFMGTALYSFKMLRGKKTLEKKYPMLWEFWRRQANKYIQKGYKEVRAKALADRDTIRVILGNAWLIATLDALTTEIIKPEEVEMPYPLAKDGTLLHQLIDPVHTVEEKYRPLFAEYSWRELVKILQKN